MSNLSMMIDAAAERHGDRVAIVDGARRLTFADLRGRAGQLARVLGDAGVGPASKVALTCPNVPEFTIAYWAILIAGGVVVPLNVMLRAREIAQHLDDSNAVAYIAHEEPQNAQPAPAARAAFDQVAGCRELWSIGAAEDGATRWRGRPLAGARPLNTVSREDDATAVIIYTSGTTGTPKGAELTHRNLRLNAHAAAAVYGIDPDRPDTYLLAAPLFHSLAQTCIQNAATATGCSLVMQRRFDAAAAVRLMIDEGVTIFAGVPTMYWALLEAQERAADGQRLQGRLRVAASGGAAMPLELHRAVETRLGVAVLEGYGLSETSPMASSGALGEPRRVGSIGRPIPGVEMRLIDEDWSDVADGAEVVGEIAIRGHNVMKGYYGRPDATAAAIRAGWFRTGDLARKDGDDYYYIVGRSKDVIIRGGYNVYPRELEEVLMAHPAVSLVAVVGVPHPSHGQEIKAVVVKRDGHESLTAGQLVAWGREQVAPYKYPRIVEFRQSLPMTATGKILKREIS